MHLGLTSLCIVLTMTCLVAMMAVFLGSDADTLDLVLLVQAGLAPLVMAIFCYYTWVALSRIGSRELLLLYRRKVPGPMWFVFWSINSLVIAGELSFLMVGWASGQRAHWLQHAPLWCAAACMFALLSMYIVGQLRHLDLE